MYYITTDDNVKIAVYDINPRCRKTVFFIHGWPLDHRIFEYQTNVLPKMGFRTVSIDLRGFGESDEAASGYSYNCLAKDVYQVIRQLKLRNITMVGFSVGGAIAARYMALFNGYGVSKLALLAAAAPKFTQGPDYPYGMPVEVVNAMIQHAYIDRPQMVSDFSELLFASEASANLKDWFKGICYDASGNGTIAVLESLRDESVESDLSKICVHTGIFHGVLDRVCPFVFAELMQQALPWSTLYRFENSGHAIFYDELEKFDECFFSFLKECSA